MIRSNSVNLEDLFFNKHPNAMLIFDMDTLGIVHVNQSFTEKYGWTEEEARELTLEDIRPEGDIPVLREKLDSLGSESKIFDLGTVRHQTKDGRVLHVQITTQHYPIEGRPTRVVHIHDLTETIALKNKYKNALEELRHQIDENPLAMIRFDHDYRIIEWSKRAEEKFGYSQEEVAGKTSFELGLFPEREHELIRKHIRDITDGRRENDRFNTIAVSKDGSEIYVRLNVSSLRTHDDNLKSVVAFIENINRQRRTEMLFKTTEEMAKIGGWEYNPNTDRLYWTDEVYRIYNMSPEEEIDVDKALSYFLPEDRERMNGDLDNLLENLQPYDSEYQMETPSGKRKWTRAMGRPVIRNNELFKVTGTFQDITERKEKEEEIFQNAREKEILLSEIHHRVKNNLAIISGLLELEAMDKENESLRDVLRRSQLRIQSMSLIHEVLYEADDFSSLEFVNFTGKLIKAIENTHEQDCKPIEIDLQCQESLKLNVNQAIPSGLIINELITNSLKHAFKGRESGRIEVQIRYDHDSDRVHLRVADNGIGLPDAFLDGETKSLGETLIRKLTDQLDGSFHKDNDGGAVVEIRFARRSESGSSSQHFPLS